MNNKKLLILTIGICIVLLGMFALLNTYVLWTVKKKQTGENIVKGTCISFRLEEEQDDNNNLITGINLVDTWPITDEKGKELKGYTFKLENKCDKQIDYEIVLESLKIEGENYFNSEYVKVQLDNKEIKRYSDLEKVESEEENNIRETRHLYSGIMSRYVEDNNTYNIRNHTIKIWISEDAPNSEIGKEFKSKIRVYAGQIKIPPEYKLSDEECFTYDIDTKTVTNYDINRCGTDLVLPPTINGNPVEKISLYNSNNDYSSLLTYVNLENAIYLKEIAQASFWRYVGTGKDLVIPDNVSEIDGIAFSDFNGNKLILGNGLTQIGSQAFQHYVGKNQTLIIPDSVLEISDYAFRSFSGEELYLGKSLTTIDVRAFVFYKGKKLIIPDNVRVIRHAAFANFNGEELHLPSSATSIGEEAFYNYVGTNKELVIPDSVSYIGYDAFCKYDGPSLVLGNNVEIIGPRAFYSYNGSNFTIPSKIKAISNNVFYSFLGIINIDISEADFEQVGKEDNWKNPNATLNFLVN